MPRTKKWERRGEEREKLTKEREKQVDIRTHAIIWDNERALVLWACRKGHAKYSFITKSTLNMSFFFEQTTLNMSRKYKIDKKVCVENANLSLNKCRLLLLMMYFS